MQLERISEPEASIAARWTGFEHACHQLQKHPKTLHRWIEKGRLRAARAGYRVFLRTLDLMRIIYSHPANREHVRTCMRNQKKIEIIARKPGQNSNLKGLNSRGHSKEIEAGRTSDALFPSEAAVALQYSFGRLARRLAPDDRFLQDDLIQEMSWIVLDFKAAATRQYFYHAARKHALNYLRYERLRGSIPLDRINEPRGVPRNLPDELLVQAMLDDGIKLETIENILEAKVNVEQAG